MGVGMKEERQIGEGHRGVIYRLVWLMGAGFISFLCPINPAVILLALPP